MPRAPRFLRFKKYTNHGRSVHHTKVLLTLMPCVRRPCECDTSKRLFQDRIFTAKIVRGRLLRRKAVPNWLVESNPKAAWGNCGRAARIGGISCRAGKLLESLTMGTRRRSARLLTGRAAGRLMVGEQQRQRILGLADGLSCRSRTFMPHNVHQYQSIN
jgi:hypothetical protein